MMHLVKSHQQPEESFSQSISDSYNFLKQQNMLTKTIFCALERGGRQVYNVAFKYGPVCVSVFSKSSTKLIEFFSLSPFDKLPMVLRNFVKSSEEGLYSSGRAFFDSYYGNFTIISLEACIFSCERLLKRLQLATKDTIIVLNYSSLSSKSLDKDKHSFDISKAATVTLRHLAGKTTESVQQTEPTPVCNDLVPESETESSTMEADPESENESLAEFISSFTLTIVYGNVTGLEKAFVLLYDMFILHPLNAIILAIAHTVKCKSLLEKIVNPGTLLATSANNIQVAFLRFISNLVKDLEACLRASKFDITVAGRRVKKNSSLGMTSLRNHLMTFYFDTVRPMKPSDSILRLESKESVGLCGSNGGLLNDLINSVTFYQEENDPDYVPISQSSDSCTESGESESDISVEETNGLLSIKEKNPVKMEIDLPTEPKDKDV